MNRLDKRIKAFLLVFGILIYLGIYMFVLIYNNLDKYNTPVKVDTIIMIDGGDTSRFTAAAQLFNEGYADNVIVSPAEETAKYNNVKAVISAGVPESAIIKEKGPTTSTWQNATHTLKIMKEKGFNSALVVTNDYHVRRTELAYARANKYNKKIIVVGFPDKNNKNWYETKTGRSLALRETIVLPVYWLGLYHYKFFDR